MKNTLKLIKKSSDGSGYYSINIEHNQEVLTGHIESGFRMYTIDIVLIINNDIDKTLDNGTKPALKLVS